MTTIVVRDTQIIAAEINSIKEQVIRNALSGSIEIGKKLKEAKDAVPHGDWGKWLEEYVDYSTSTANNLMRVYEEYGNNQALGDLNYTQAVALLAVPAEEREDFVKENNAKALSSRELQKAIKAKEILEQQLKDTQAIAEKERIAHEKLQKSNDELLLKTKSYDEQVAKLSEDLTKAQATGDNMTAKKLKTDLDKAKADHTAAVKKVKELEEQLNKKPTDADIPEETKKELETLRKAKEEHAAQILQANQEADQKIAAMQSELEKNNNTELISVRTAVKALSHHFEVVLSAIGEIKNPDEQEALKNNVKILLDRLKEAVV